MNINGEIKYLRYQFGFRIPLNIKNNYFLVFFSDIPALSLIFINISGFLNLFCSLVAFKCILFYKTVVQSYEKII